LGHSCNFCHTDQFTDWAASPHAGAARNPWVVDLYRSDFRAGFFENGVDTCAGCHAPSLASTSSTPDHADARLDEAAGVHSKGVHCDFCHKIASAAANDLPGVYGGLTLLRPSLPPGSGDLGLMFGTLADSTYPFMRSSPKALYRESTVCAPCHQDTNAFGVPSNDTFAEWMASPARREGQTCQSCHMPPDPDRTSLVDPFLARLGETRPPGSVRSHDVRAITEDVLAEAVELVPGAVTRDGRIDASCLVRSRTRGHSLPTGIPERQMILLVLATDPAGSPLPLLAGPVLDEGAGVAGASDPLADRIAEGNLAGLPGFLFARRTFGLTVDGTNLELDVPYWRAFEILSDTRLGPEGERSIAWQFAAPPGGGEARLEFRLLHRRLPKPLHDARNLGRFSASEHAPNDLLFVSKTIDGEGRPLDTIPPTVEASPPGGVYASAIQVTLRADEPATIFFTLDGSEPSEESLIFESAIPISSLTVLKFFAVDTAGNRGETRTETYAVSPGGPVSLGRDVQPILNRHCALASGCHAGISPAANQNLSAGLTWVNVVNVDSVEVPTLKRVRPFESNQSYLVNKIEGTAGEVGGVPSRMPPGRPPLSPGEIQTIRRWIDQGALDH
jgi:hypothetical protein